MRQDPSSRRKRLLAFGLGAGLSLPLAQFLHFAYVCHHAGTLPKEARLVLVYSGMADRLGEGLAWAKKDPQALILCSGWDYSLPALSKITGLPASRFLLENRARTTDQNARYGRSLVLSTGEKKAVLALPWYHLPRALFLTRLYLAGTGVEVAPYATVPAPKDWWKRRMFYVEFLKFWGSMARVALALFGIENWPRPSAELSPKL